MLPLWLKIVYSLFAFMLVPIYWRQYGPVNFLWFSDVALFALVPALWLESPLLVSMMALAVLLPELAWNLEYFLRLATGVRLYGLTDYMFDARIRKSIRALSLFHVVLPPMLMWLLWNLGYDDRALVWQSVLAAVVLLLSYRFSTPEENVNWVYGFAAKPQQKLPGPVFVLLLIVLFPAALYLPTHLLLTRLF
jgi:hypothetical protein